MPDPEALQAAEAEITQLRDALVLARMVIEQGGTMKTRIAGNGPAISEVIRKALHND
jgi:hypothetical protein